MESKKLTKGLFAVYFLALVWIILFKMQMPFAMAGHSRSINLVPFAGSVIVNDTIYLDEIIDNVLIFIPYGIFTCMLGRSRTFPQKMIPIFFTSLALEVLQFVLAAGASDVTDLITNTAGGMIGIAIFHIFARVFRDKVYQVVNVVTLVGAAGMILLVGILLAVNH